MFCAFHIIKKHLPILMWLCVYSPQFMWLTFLMNPFLLMIHCTQHCTHSKNNVLTQFISFYQESIYVNDSIDRSDVALSIYVRYVLPGMSVVMFHWRETPFKSLCEYGQTLSGELPVPIPCLFFFQILVRINFVKSIKIFTYPV